MNTVESSAWKPLAPGFTITGSTPPITPLCGHEVLTQMYGWFCVCEKPATVSRTSELGIEYACDDHNDRATIIGEET